MGAGDMGKLRGLGKHRMAAVGPSNYARYDLESCRMDGSAPPCPSVIEYEYRCTEYEYDRADDRWR